MIVSGRIEMQRCKKVLEEISQHDFVEIQCHIVGAISVVMVWLARYALEHIKQHNNLIRRDA